MLFATAEAVLAQFPLQVQGCPNASFVCVSSGPLPAEARDAVAASAERLGYGRENVAWIEVAPPAGEGEAPAAPAGAVDLATSSAEVAAAGAPDVTAAGEADAADAAPIGSAAAGSAPVVAGGKPEEEGPDGSTGLSGKSAAEAVSSSVAGMSDTYLDEGSPGVGAEGHDVPAASTADNPVALAEPAAADPAPLTELQLRTVVEGLDPVALVVADAAAAALLAEAYRQPVFCDHPNRLSARSVAAFTNFAALLETPEGKQRAWSLLKELALE